MTDNLFKHLGLPDFVVDLHCWQVCIFKTNRHSFLDCCCGYKASNMCKTYGTLMGNPLIFLKEHHCTQHVTRAWTRTLAIRRGLTLGCRFSVRGCCKKKLALRRDLSMSKDMWELEANLFKHFSKSSISQRLVFKLNCFPLLILLSQGTQAAVEEPHRWVCGWYFSKVGRCCGSSCGFDALNIVGGTSSRVCEESVQT